MEYLCYVMKAVEDFSAEKKIDLLFTSNIDNVWGDDWNSPFPTPPDSYYVSSVLSFYLTESDFVPFYSLNHYTMIDAIEGVVSLGYELMDFYADDEDSRLVFHFGDTLDKITYLLRSRDIEFEYFKTKIK